MILSFLAGTVPLLAQDGHEFVFTTPESVRSVNLAGTFNSWNASATPMVMDADGRTWRRRVNLNPGKHLYKFVLNGDRWITDPKAARNEDDGNGNVNSVLLLTPANWRPTTPDDGQTTTSALRHDPTTLAQFFDRGRLRLTLRTRRNDVKAVLLKAGNQTLKMDRVAQDEFYETYVAHAAWDRKADFRYRFVAIDGPRRTTVGPFRLAAKSFRPFTVPAWVERSVMYQIFPDRFANGSQANDPADVLPWDGKPTWFNRFGGDAVGVQQRIPHLKSLGVDTVYFNPVFRSPSNHRYDATDFRQIDPQFGTNAEFATLTRELQRNGIRTLMDFVFNHSATDFPPFLDLRTNGETSKYRNWFFPKSFPIRVENNPNYEAWFGFPSMPKLNVRNPETERYLLDLVNFWRAQVPLMGLRLDVANEVDPVFWRQLRNRVKGIDPNIWIVGEVWGDGSPWLRGDQWDSVMNYQFRGACLGFIAEGNRTPEQFMKDLMRVHLSYAPQVSRNMMNLLSSHDTPRFLTLCGENADKHRLAAAVQFTWVGSPSIYYGEEIGMTGGPDPENRRGMEWPRATNDNPMLRHYRQLVKIRQSSPALQSGDPVVLATNNEAGTFAYARTLPTDLAIVAGNRSAQPQTISIPLPKSVPPARAANGFFDALTGRRFAARDSIRLTLDPFQAVILRPGKPAANSTQRPTPARPARPISQPISTRSHN